MSNFDFTKVKKNGELLKNKLSYKKYLSYLYVYMSVVCKFILKISVSSMIMQPFLNQCVLLSVYSVDNNKQNENYRAQNLVAFFRLQHTNTVHIVEGLMAETGPSRYQDVLHLLHLLMFTFRCVRVAQQNIIQFGGHFVEMHFIVMD